MPRAQRPRWQRGLFGLGVVSLILAGLAAGRTPSLIARFRPKPSRTHLETKKVERADLEVTLTAGGRVDSSDRTVIECELERLDFNVRGYGYSAGGSSTVLSVLPEGTRVKKGDILCELDSYDYQELLRQQQINMERVKSDYEQATLNVDIAKIAIVEYRDGLMAQTLKDLRGRIALAESDFERCNDRLKWTRNMFEKGYVSRGQVTTEEFESNRLALGLQQNRTALALFEKFSAPKYLRVLESDVLAAETVLNYQTMRLKRTKERLQKLDSQIKLCTIRAPHDGFLIYATDESRTFRLEEGVSVRQRQKLFYLPDLKNMEVVAQIHESVIKDVKQGMKVNVIVEGLPGRKMTGRVTSISQLPVRNDFNDVRNFVGVVKLDAIPDGLKPGMTAEVEIGVTKRPHVLAIPTEALAVRSGADFCFVVHEDHLERRPITLGRSTRSLLEITAGLKEGEEVVVEPSQVNEPVEVADAVPTEPEVHVETAHVTH